MTAVARDPTAFDWEGDDVVMSDVASVAMAVADLLSDVASSFPPAGPCAAIIKTIFIQVQVQMCPCTAWRLEEDLPCGNVDFGFSRSPDLRRSIPVLYRVFGRTEARWSSLLGASVTWAPSFTAC
jgi:hypothetical protein